MRVTVSTKRNRPYLLGVAGGSGSGKTYFAEALRAALGSGICEIVYQDNFYIDQSKRFDHDGGSVNFDHPDAIDFPLLAERLAHLRAGNHTQIPIYDFKTHSRKAEKLEIDPKPIIIVDGILIFHHQGVREQFDQLVFFDTPEELRYSRRLRRDVEERGRTPEGVKAQFDRQVKPMHDQFVAPSVKFAHRVVRDAGEFSGVLAEYGEQLRKLL